MLRRGLEHYGIYMLNWAVTYTIVAVAGSMFIPDGCTDGRMDRWTDGHERKQQSAFRSVAD